MPIIDDYQSAIFLFRAPVSLLRELDHSPNEVDGLENPMSARYQKFWDSLLPKWKFPIPYFAAYLHY